MPVPLESKIRAINFLSEACNNIDYLKGSVSHLLRSVLFKLRNQNFQADEKIGIIEL